ncbi:MAG: FHA domain-containing protein [Solirubrobacteraceae bacterium]
MTIETATKPVGPYKFAAPRELETAPIEAPVSETITDSFALLDHRTRSRAVTPRLAPRGPYLQFRDGEDTWLLPLEEKITHIGRGLSSEVRLEDQRVSRSHAIVVRHGRYARVLDNRSSHGTFLNGRRIVATNIGDGDVISVGPVTMQFVELR